MLPCWRRLHIPNFVIGPRQTTARDASSASPHRAAIGEGTGRFAYDTPNGTWHTVIPVAGPAAFLEVKQGPYDPATAADFASWAPAEGEGSVPRFQQWLREAPTGSLYSV